MGILLVNLIDKVLCTTEVLIKELHSVPCIVTAPVLPVLNDTIERNTKFAVLAHHSYGLVLSLVTLTALVETVCPERKHRSLACEVAHLLDNAIGILAIHEVVVRFLSYLTLKNNLSSFALLWSSEVGRRVIIPVDSVALNALVEMSEVLKIALLHTAVLVTLTHLAVLEKTNTIYFLILVERESLLYLEGISIRPRSDRRKL